MMIHLPFANTCLANENLTGDVGELNVSSGGQFFLDKVRKNAFSKTTEVDDHDFHAYALAQSRASRFINYQPCDVVY